MSDLNIENVRTIHSIGTEFKTRDIGNDGEDPTIEGYFAVFDGIYEIGPKMSESIDRHAFDSSINGDVRALVDHDTSKVLGRTIANTLELRVDDHGLFGKIAINPKDSDAMNLYERVKRGDVSQCSFGFEIIKENTEIREDGSTHWTIQDLKLYEISPCTFPAYPTTNVIASRSAQAETFKTRKRDAWKSEMLKKLKGAKEDGTKSLDDCEEAK